MNKLLTKALLPLFVFMGTVLFAQTRVFKEVEGDIKTELKTIRQDNQLVGYLAFTRLEKASEDSINYRITIMDENLNDLGVINFKDISLKMQGVSYEGDIICIAYLRSPVSLENPKIPREDFDFIIKKQKKDIGVFFQFITLQGKINNKLMIPEEIAKFDGATKKSKKGSVQTSLNKTLQLQNVRDKGFVAYYGNGLNGDNTLLYFTTDGKKNWQKKLPEFDSYVLQTASSGIHLLANPKPVFHSSDVKFPAPELLSYGYEKGDAAKPLKLKDPKQSDLQVLSYRTNPETGKLNILGLIQNQDRDWYPLTYLQLSKKPYNGLFSIEVNSMEKGGLNAVYTYYGDQKTGTTFDGKGRIVGDKQRILYDNAYMDGNGVSYFAGTRIKRKPKFVAIGLSVITIPTIIVPPMIALFSYTKFQQSDGQVMVLKKDGTLGLQNPIPVERSKYFNPRSYISLTNPNDFNLAKGISGEDYYLITSSANLYIYHAKDDKLVRTIPLKVGKESLNIFPAKEGYFMVEQYNAKDKTTSLSIEAL
jgi:hypothetical protein